MISATEKIEFDGTKLPLLRKPRTQADLAKHIGITRQALSQIEEGKTKPSADTLIKICVVLKIPIENLSKKF